jgi:NAD-dependent dihydropyrimidine dehydrogenase PreA subunit
MKYCLLTKACYSQEEINVSRKQLTNAKIMWYTNEQMSITEPGKEKLMMFYVDSSKCKGCGLCVEACPQQAISMKGEVAFVNQDLCAGCGTCREICNNNAIYEVEVITPTAVRTGKQQSNPLVKPGPVMFKNNTKKTTLFGALTTLVPIVIEGLASLTKQWVASGRGQGNKRGQNSRGQGRRCRRKGWR